MRRKSKNYYFDRDLERQRKTALRNLDICILYQSLHSVRDVAEILGISTQTVKNVLKSGCLEPTSDSSSIFTIDINAVKTEW